MQNILLWVKNSVGGYKFRYNDNTDMMDGYIRLQIENSLRLGWNIKDIVLITNFDFEYMGVKANKVDDICNWSAFANKMVLVDMMIKKGVINDDFWLHDLDAYQLVPFEFPKECKDVGFTRHAPGRSKPQGGSYFYRKSGYDVATTKAEMIKIFKPSKEESFFPVFYSRVNGQRSADKYCSRFDAFQAKYNKMDVGGQNKHKATLEEYKIQAEMSRKYFGAFEDRVCWLDWTYNLFRVKHFARKYPNTEKPVKVVHFHPEVFGAMDCFVNGNNKFNVKIVTPELLDLMKKHKVININDIKV